jgi:hypothetical protein
MSFPIEIPAQPAFLSFPDRVWPRLADALYLLAKTGKAIRLELQTILGQKYQLSPRSKSLRSVFERYLPAEELIEQQNFRVFRGIPMTVVRLTAKGEALCARLGWEAVESEWSRLIRLHTGDRQPAHTGAVLAFAYNARLRGWTTQVVPPVENPHVFPDVLIAKEQQKIYVEVELRTQKFNKWAQLNAFQGFVALCAKSPSRRDRLVRECQGLQIPGMATDLVTLYSQSRKTPIGALWLQEWGETSGAAK